MKCSMTQRIPVSRADLDWQVHAACRAEPMDTFYSGEEADISRALDLCRRCEVRDECLSHAMTHEERFGVWGGTTERERRRFFRNARRENSTAA